MIILEITMEELEKLIIDYAESKVGESFTIKALNFHEVTDCSTRIKWDMLKDIFIEVEF